MLEVDIKHHFGDFTVDASFKAPAGITVLFGRSGSGKTSIINAVAGLLQPQQGVIKLNGTTLLDRGKGVDKPVHQRGIGYIFQQDRLFPHLNVQQNLSYGQKFHTTKTPAEPIIELLGISHLLQRRTSGLSGGERQRVAIGRALMSNPKLVLADEPLTALDEQRKTEILPYFERLRDELNVPVLYVSHSAAEVARLATTVVAVDQGEVTLQGSVQDVLGAPQTFPVGIEELGAVIDTTVHSHDDDGLTQLTAGSTTLYVPGQAGAPGQPLRLRIPAHEVLIALEQPQHISAMNMLPATVSEIDDAADHHAVVQLETQAGNILSRITHRSVQRLGLTPGKPCFAIVKSLAIDPH